MIKANKASGASVLMSIYSKVQVGLFWYEWSEVNYVGSDLVRRECHNNLQFYPDINWINSPSLNFFVERGCKLLAIAGFWHFWQSPILFPYLK